MAPDSGVIPVTPDLKSQRPVDAAEFERLMGDLGSPENLAIAVSGGSDSMALCLLAARWAAINGHSVKAVTVDHGLRAESSDEAAQVGRWLSARNIEHHILRWSGPKPKTGIQAAARNARYALMADWMAEEGIADLALAHHAEDQAETFLLRAGQGSGIDGLASMAPVSRRQGVRILRPLLGTLKSRLTATLEAANQPWIEDPSNQDLKYTRVQLRTVLPGLSERGIDPVRISALAGKFSELRRRLCRIDRIAISACSTLHPEGFVTLDADYLSKLPLILRCRIIRQLIHAISGFPYPPRRAAIDRLVTGLSAGNEFRGATLGGCRLLPWRGRILLCREARNLGPHLALQSGKPTVWNGLFDVQVSGGNVTIGPLGPERRLAPDQVDPEQLNRFPIPVRATLPAFYVGERLLAVPQLGYNDEPAAGLMPTVEKLRFIGFDKLLITTDCLDLGI